MAIDRSLRSNPLIGEGQGLEIEIENPEAVSIETEDGGVILDFDPDASTLASSSWTKERGQNYALGWSLRSFSPATI